MKNFNESRRPVAEGPPSSRFGCRNGLPWCWGDFSAPSPRRVVMWRGEETTEGWADDQFEMEERRGGKEGRGSNQVAPRTVSQL